YSKGVSSAALDGLVRGDKENVLVVLAQDEYSVDGVIARISSVRNNLVARGVKVGPITIVGSSSWQRFVNVDKNLFFKLNVCLVTNYHADRSNPVVMAFNKRYIAAFGALPSLYSYRGYDAVKLFVGTYARRGDEIFETAVNHSSQQLLQMPYHFTQKTRTATHINRDWALVCYRSDYTIEVK
ncbi:MAG: hypothetical protein LBU95_03265, partial [Rikenellaceae bacterium]|nr:hypothetical protein [Rikenellaceae bacterium]